MGSIHVPPPLLYINLGAYFLLKCLRLSWVWPAALKSFCMLRLNDVFTLFLVLGRPQGQKVGAFLSKSDENHMNSEINVPNHGLTSKTTGQRMPIPPLAQTTGTNSSIPPPPCWTELAHPPPQVQGGGAYYDM